jgi:hypothetical protein
MLAIYRYSEVVYSTWCTAQQSLLAVPRDLKVDCQLPSYCMSSMTFSNSKLPLIRVHIHLTTCPLP